MNAAHCPYRIPIQHDHLFRRKRILAVSSWIMHVVTLAIFYGPGSGAWDGFPAEHKLPLAAAAGRPSGAGHPCKVHAVQPLRPASDRAGGTEQPRQQQCTCTLCRRFLQGRLIRAMTLCSCCNRRDIYFVTGELWGMQPILWTACHLVLSL